MWLYEVLDRLNIACEQWHDMHSLMGFLAIGIKNGWGFKNTLSYQQISLHAGLYTNEHVG